MKNKRRVMLSLDPKQAQELSQNMMKHIKATEEVVSLQEYIRRVLAESNNSLKAGK